MNIHRPKLRWCPKLGHIVHRRICPSIRDRLRRWREAVNTVALRDENRPKIKNLVCWGGVCNRTRSGRVPEQVWTRHRPATGTGPVNFCRCERNTNEWNGTGTRTGTSVNTALQPLPLATMMETKSQHPAGFKYRSSISMDSTITL